MTLTLNLSDPLGIVELIYDLWCEILAKKLETDDEDDIEASMAEKDAEDEVEEKARVIKRERNREKLTKEERDRLRDEESDERKAARQAKKDKREAARTERENAKTERENQKKERKEKIKENMKAKKAEMKSDFTTLFADLKDAMKSSTALPGKISSAVTASISTGAMGPSVSAGHVPEALMNLKTEGDRIDGKCDSVLGIVDKYTTILEPATSIPGLNLILSPITVTFELISSIATGIKNSVRVVGAGIPTPSISVDVPDAPETPVDANDLTPPEVNSCKGCKAVEFDISKFSDLQVYYYNIIKNHSEEALSPEERLSEEFLLVKECLAGTRISCDLCKHAPEAIERSENQKFKSIIVNYGEFVVGSFCTKRKS